MTKLHELPPFRSDDGLVNVVIETPKGSRAKYKYDSGLAAFELHKALSLGFSYPFAFGFIPGTRGEDGDPLDVLLVTTLEPPLGTLVPARLIGVIEVSQADPDRQPVRNDRLLAVPDVGHEDRPLDDIAGLRPAELDDIEAFFVESGARDGKQLTITGRQGAAKALALVRNSRNPSS